MHNNQDSHPRNTQRPGWQQRAYTVSLCSGRFEKQETMIGRSRNFVPRHTRGVSRDGQTPDRMVVRPQETTKGETLMKRQRKYLFAPDMAGSAHRGGASW
jgi:hypothetical protein